MSILGKLFGTAIDVAILPVDMLKDVVNLGETTYTEDRADAIMENLEEMFDE